MDDNWPCSMKNNIDIIVRWVMDFINWECKISLDFFLNINYLTCNCFIFWILNSYPQVRNSTTHLTLIDKLLFIFFSGFWYKNITQKSNKWCPLFVRQIYFLTWVSIYSIIWIVRCAFDGGTDDSCECKFKGRYQLGCYMYLGRQNAT